MRFQRALQLGYHWDLKLVKNWSSTHFFKTNPPPPRRDASKSFSTCFSTVRATNCPKAFMAGKPGIYLQHVGGMGWNKALRCCCSHVG